jgi:hypothetical protein
MIEPPIQILLEFINAGIALLSEGLSEELVHCSPGEPLDETIGFRCCHLGTPGPTIVTLQKDLIRIYACAFHMTFPETGIGLQTCITPDYSSDSSKKMLDNASTIYIHTKL